MNHTAALIVATLVGPIIGYLSGSILWSIVIGKMFFNVDIRMHASKNAGATNTSRVLGKKIGLLILFLDVMKSFLPTLIIWLIIRFGIGQDSLKSTGNFNEYSLVYLASLFAIIGHCFPVFYGFKGGKGVSCFCGMILAISPFLAMASLMVFVIVLFIKKYVSLSSIIGSFSTWIFIFIPGIDWMYMTNDNIATLNLVGGYNYLSVLVAMSFCLTGSCLLTIKHRENIVRLMNHSERKLNLSHKIVINEVNEEIEANKVRKESKKH